MQTPTRSLHPLLKDIAFLVGKWKGTGKGVYPTIKSFNYGEEIVVNHIGKPVLIYNQKTWNLDDPNCAPLHAEMGYFRPQQDNGVELLLAQPSGITTIEEGKVTPNRIVISSKCIARSSTAKEPFVTATRRIYTRNENKLFYSMEMETNNTPMQIHLTAELELIEQS